MASVFTKNEILKELANRGYFIDSYTLDTFFQKWKIEVIFEDEQGSEFFDKNALDLVLSNLFSQKAEEEKKEEIKKEEPKTEEVKKEEAAPQEEIKEPAINENKEEIKPEVINDKETVEVLKNISLSDGTPLIEKVQDGSLKDVELIPADETVVEPKAEAQDEPFKFQEYEPKPQRGVLESAMEGLEVEGIKPQENESEKENKAIEPVDDRLFEIHPEAIESYNVQSELMADGQDSPDFDDISLISESLEAQERFKNYLVSELSKKNVDLAPRQNEFKLDISERTLSMIARTMAKKIAKHVSAICSQDARATAKLEDIQAKNEKLEQKAKELEEQNKKLRLLLAESNKNLNSYKPSLFGLYKKVTPNK